MQEEESRLPINPTSKGLRPVIEKGGAIFAPMRFSLRWLWIVLAVIALAVIGFGAWVLVVAHTFRNGI